MSLTDTDKNSDKRGNPQLNQNDQILHRMANATTSVHPVTDSTTTSGYLQTSNGRILGNDGTNNVGLFGFDDNGNMVVKVAKPGYDANNAANENLIFNSAQNVFKIVSKGTATIPSFSVTTGNGSSLLTIAHGLSFVPIVHAFAQLYLMDPSTVTPISSIYVPLPAVPIYQPTDYHVNTSGTYRPVNVAFAVDNTNLYFRSAYWNGSSSFTIASISVTYFLLQETAN